jgi:hypothetical protein
MAIRFRRRKIIEFQRIPLFTKDHGTHRHPHSEKVEVFNQPIQSDQRISAALQHPAFDSDIPDPAKKVT